MKKATNTNAGDTKKVSAPPSIPEFNPISRYQEKVVVPYLTLFDIERKARESNKKICRLPINSVNTLFHCPVCLGYMKKTFIVMECLHRFCGDCIQKCLRLGKKECPSCRVHIPSRRSLRPDLNYDELVSKEHKHVFFSKLQTRKFECILISDISNLAEKDVWRC